MRITTTLAFKTEEPDICVQIAVGYPYTDEKESGFFFSLGIGISEYLDGPSWGLGTMKEQAFQNTKNPHQYLGVGFRSEWLPKMPFQYKAMWIDTCIANDVGEEVQLTLQAIKDIVYDTEYKSCLIEPWPKEIVFKGTKEEFCKSKKGKAKSFASVGEIRDFGVAEEIQRKISDLLGKWDGRLTTEELQLWKEDPKRAKLSKELIERAELMMKELDGSKIPVAEPAPKKPLQTMQSMVNKAV